MAESTENTTPDPIAEFLLRHLSEHGSASPEEVARAFAENRRNPTEDGPADWRRHFRAVKQQALHLARNGRLQMLRKGKLVDPRDARGVVRYRLAGGPGPSVSARGHAQQGADVGFLFEADQE